jgi:hypothetical protein
MSTVLFVCPDPTWGAPVADAIEAAGHELMWCRGPSGPDCVCSAIRGGRCALTGGIDVVVIDSWLTSDRLGHGFRSWQLVEYYEHLGLPVVALQGLPELARGADLGPRTVAVPRRSAPVDIARVVDIALALNGTTSTSPGFPRSA